MDTLEFKVQNSVTNQSLGELELWPPPQGTPKVMIPVLIDLRFDHEDIDLHNLKIAISARRATVTMTMSGPEIVRHSRFGDYLHAPYVVANITESARKILDTESRAEAGGEFSITSGFMGILRAAWSVARSQKASQQTDNIVNAAMNVYRIVARTGNRWEIVEPIHPKLLSGKYFGASESSRDGDRNDPLCFITFRSAKDVLDLWLTVNRGDLHIEINGAAGKRIGRNKEAVLDQIVRRCLKVEGVGAGPVSPLMGPNTLVLCHSQLRVENEL